MRKILLLSFLVYTSVEVYSQVRGFGTLSPITPPSSDTPIEDGCHPRWLMTETACGDYGTDFNTVSEVRARINASQLLRTRIAENIAELETRYDSIAPVVLGCTVATPTVCTTQTPHGIDSSYVIWMHGHTSTPNLNDTYLNITVLTTTTFSLQSYPADTNITVTSDSGGGAMSFTSSTDLLERAFEFAFYYHILNDGVLRNADDTADVPHAHTANEYGDKAVDILVAYLGSAGAASAAYASEAPHPEILIPGILDWAWDKLSSSQRVELKNFIKGSEAGGSYTLVGHEFKSTTSLMRAYFASAAVVLSNEGYDGTFWEDELTRFSARNFSGSASFACGWSEYGDTSSSSVIEGFSYFGYNFEAVLTGYAAHRVGNALTKAAFYNLTCMSHWVNSPQLFILLELPYASTSAYYATGYRHGLMRGHYSHLWNNEMVASEITHYAQSVINGEMGHLDPGNMSELGLWFQNNRTQMNLAHGTGTGLGPAGASGWIISAILANFSFTPLDPEDAGLTASTYFTDNFHVYRDNIADLYSVTGLNHSMVMVYTPKWATGVATGRSPTYMAGNIAMEFKGPILACQNGISHSGKGSVFCQPSFPTIVRIRQEAESAPNSFYDDLGGVRNATLAQLDVIESQEEWIEDGVADFKGEHLYENADVSAGRMIDWVAVDLSKAYYNRDAVVNDINPKVVDYMQSSYFNIRGASPGYTAKLVRIDRWGLQAAKVGVNEPIITIVPSAEPTFTGGSAPVAVSRMGQANCQQQYGSATSVDWSTTAAITGYTYDAKGHMTILLPASRQVLRRGGQGAAVAKWTNTGWGTATNSCEFVDAAGFTWPPTGGGSVDYIDARAAEIGPYAIEVRDTSGNQTGVFIYTIEGLTVAGTAATSAVLTGLTGGYTGARLGTAILVAPNANDNSISAGTWTASVSNATVYQMIVTGPSAGSHTLNCTNTSSFTQLDPVDVSSPYTFAANGQAYFQFTSTSTSITCTIG